MSGLVLSPATLGPDGRVPSTKLPVAAIYAKDPAYGAVGDGSTDDTSALRAASSAAVALDVPVYLAPGTYNVSGLIHNSGPTSNAVRFVGAGRRKTIIQRTVSTRFVDQRGSVGTAVALTADLAYGGTSCTVAALPTNLAVDDYVELRSDTVIAGNAKNAEVQRVKSITGTGPYTITFYGATEETYTTAANAVIARLSHAGPLLLDGITFQQSAVDRGDTAEAVYMQFGLRPEVKRCQFRNLDWPGVSPTSCVDWLVEDCHFERLIDNLGANRIGYGINDGDNGVGGRVVDCTARNVRHLYTTNGGYAGPRHTLISGCKARETTNGAFNTHKEGRFITFQDCEEFASNLGAASFYIRCPNVQIINGKVITHVGAGVTIAESDSADCEIIGGEYGRRQLGLTGASTNMITVQSPRCKIIGPTIDGARNMSVRVETYSTGAAPDGCFISNVRSRNPSGGHLEFNTGASHYVQSGYFEHTGTRHMVKANGSAGQVKVGQGLYSPSGFGKLIDPGGTAGAVVIDQPELNIKALTASATLAGDEHLVTIDPTAGNVTVTLPSATFRPGRKIKFKRISGGANTVTISRAGTATIDGATTYTGLAAQWDKVTLQSDGTNWLVV